MSTAWKDLRTALITLAVVATGFFFVPARWSASARTVAVAVIAVITYGLIVGVATAAPRTIRWLAVKTAEFLAFGLRQWGEQNREARAKDTLWNWMIDQLLVAQGRYAFSISCIAFSMDCHQTVRCLLLRRRFQRFTSDQIWMWPGGRSRGIDGDIGKELRDLVLNETGCAVDLLPLTRTIVLDGFSETVLTYNHDTGRTDLENQLVGSPLIVMQQNRPQRSEVPGHIDLVYLARVRDGGSPRGDASLLRIDELGGIHESQLWWDTRVCINRAADEFERVIKAKEAPNAPARRP
jgi:hypothetical protein